MLVGFPFNALPHIHALVCCLLQRFSVPFYRDPHLKAHVSLRLSYS